MVAPVPAPARLSGSAPSAVPLRSSVAPALTIVLPPVPPSDAGSVTCTPPTLIVSVPPKVFAPLRTSVPAPVLLTAKLPPPSARLPVRLSSAVVGLNVAAPCSVVVPATESTPLPPALIALSVEFRPSVSVETDESRSLPKASMLMVAAAASATGAPVLPTFRSAGAV